MDESSITFQSSISGPGESGLRGPWNLLRPPPHNTLAPKQFSPSVSLVPGVSIMVMHDPVPKKWSDTHEIASVLEVDLCPTANVSLSPNN